MKVLFVCKHNRFRSKVAEAFFKKYDRKDKVRSGGIIKDIDASKNVVKVLKGFKIKLKDKKSRKLENRGIEWADLIVIVADNVSKSIFKGKKILVWKISDVSQNDIKGIKNRVNKIKKKVKGLIAKLNKKV